MDLKTDNVASSKLICTYFDDINSDKATYTNIE